MPLPLVPAALFITLAAPPVDYVRDIKPLLAEKCYSCHGAWKQKGKLRLETVALMRHGGRGGPAVVPGKPDAGTLLERLASTDEHERMPPEGEGETLTPDQLATFRAWIAAGAPAPDEPTPADPRGHWAFVPPKRGQIPQAKHHDPNKPDQARNPIDAFLEAEREKRGLVAEPEADRHTLLRRVYLDLIGLPPTAGELRAFLADDSPDAFEKVVDQLLASPRHGERWGRHWLDVWRYSDWSGENNNQVRGSPKHVWRWRDYVIEAVNADTPFDRVVADMLAADELTDDPARLRATGFLARNYYKFNRNVWLDDTVEHTAKAFLGLTLGCCKCHDHKFDPVSQEEYYRLRAVFEPHQVRTDPVPGQKDVNKDGLVRVFDQELATPTYVFHRGDETKPDRDNPLTPGPPEVLGGTYDPRPLALPDGAPSSGRRLALARWLTDRANPLTARVAVNHVWLRHFGSPLTDAVADFGLRAPLPRHAALLDWLAVEFMENGWSLKKLHRLMVTSAAYKMRSDTTDARPANRERDGDNLYLWRANAQRLEAEVIRDGLLHAAGNLDTAMGGPEIPLTDGESSRRRAVYFRHAHERQVKFLEAFDAASPLECYRRAVTVVPQQALALLNSPLALDQARLLARGLADAPDAAFVTAAFERVLSRPPSPAEAGRCAKFLAEQTARLADPSKLTPAPGGPAGAVAASTDPKQRAREDMVHALFNHTDFVTVR